MGLLARFYKGGLTIPQMMRMRFRQDIKPWYDIFILQSTEEEIVMELRYDDKGNKRQLPSPEKLRKIVLQRIKDNRG